MSRGMRTLVVAGLLFASGAAEARPYDAANGPGPGQPLDAKAELQGIETEVRRFEEATREYSGTVTHIVQQEYGKKRKALMSRYQGQLDQLDKDVRVRRDSAILLFESFLAKYPSDDRWSPDAMFRLAELYFEKNFDDYLAATASQQAGAAELKPDYSKTIDLYKALVQRFPHYRLIDGALYLMGWCLNEMGKESESLVAMQALTCANKHSPLEAPPVIAQQSGKDRSFVDPYGDCEPIKKDSHFLPEAWTRIGEYHFDNNELSSAIAAYQRVIRFTDSAYYDKALYKLAWSFYRADRYREAIKGFDDLIVFSDKKKAESGAGGSDLRTEAIQYLGISFAEKDWNGDSIDDAESGLDRARGFYRGREKEPHVREVFAKLGDIYFDETEYFRAIAVYKYTLEQWPYDPSNPKVQDRIVTAFERQRDFTHALVERETLAKSYLKGSEWYKHNRDNKEATDAAAELAEYALIQAAVNHHKAAQELKKLAVSQPKPDPRIYENVAKEYALAADAYEKYLESYPNSKNTYEYSYSYADTLYYSGRFADAAKAYEKVRDSNLDNKYAEDSAFNAVKSYEKQIEVDTTAGKYSQPPLPKVGEVKVPVTPLAIPELVLKMQAAYDTYVKAVPKSGRVPTLSYKAAEIDYRYLHWDTARPRMEALVAKFCKDGDIGANAGNALIVSYTVENNLDKLDEWANKLRGLSCGSTEVAAKNATELGKLSLGIKFKRADQLLADKKYEEAAALYVQIVDADPKGEDSDKALNNAAVAYENVKRFVAATKLYERIVTEYPQSKFVDEALFRTAASYQKGFEFDKAVVSYLRLAQDPRFAASTHRTDAVYNAASIMENDQDYAKAAELFRRYAADKNVKRDDQAEAAYRAALITEKMRNPDATIKAMNEYIKTYGSDPKGGQRTLEAEFKIATAYETKKDRAAADRMYKKIVADGASVAPASDQAEYPAHAAFILTEQRLPAIEHAKIQGGGKKLVESINSFKKAVQDDVAEYNKVLTFKRASWTLAAYFRTGYMYETFSKALLAAPCPPEVKKLGPEGCDVYREQIEQAVSQVDDEAVKRYGTTLEQAGKLGVSNEWTRLARLRANQYKPDLFPLVKDERIQMETP